MQKFFKAVAFVTIFSVLTRALGFFLRIYLSRVMGAETLGAYQVAMSIFGVLMTLISSGLPLVVSRNVAYFNNQKNLTKTNKNITAGLIICVAISVVVCVILAVCPNILKVFVKSQESVEIILILLPALVASAIYAILRGGLWGKKCFFTISFTEFFEQVVRIILCIILFSVPIGLSAGQKSALSLTLSCIMSALLVIVLYFAFGGRLTNPKGEFCSILKTSTPITLVRTISAIVGSLVAIIIPLRLTKYGYTQSEALAQFGIIMGMTMPLIMVPNTFTSSIAVALVPEISGHTNNIKKQQAKDFAGLSNKVTNALKTTIVISCLLMPCFVSMGKPICQVLFSNQQAGQYLIASAIIMLPMGINQICSSILNALGLEIRALIDYAIGSVGLILSIIFLPQYIGTYSVVVGLGLMNILTSALSLSILCKRKLIDLSFFKTIALCLLICGFTTLLGWLVYMVMIKFSGMFISVAVGCIFAFIYTILLLMVFNVANIKAFWTNNIRFKRKRRVAFSK